MVTMPKDRILYVRYVYRHAYNVTMLKHVLNVFKLKQMLRMEQILLLLTYIISTKINVQINVLHFITLIFLPNLVNNVYYHVMTAHLNPNVKAVKWAI